MSELSRNAFVDCTTCFRSGSSFKISGFFYCHLSRVIISVANQIRNVVIDTITGRVTGFFGDRPSVIHIIRIRMTKKLYIYIFIYQKSQLQFLFLISITTTFAVWYFKINCYGWHMCYGFSRVVDEIFPESGVGSLA